MLSLPSFQSRKSNVSHLAQSVVRLPYGERGLVSDGDYFEVDYGPAKRPNGFEEIGHGPVRVSGALVRGNHEMHGWFAQDFGFQDRDSETVRMRPTHQRVVHFQRRIVNLHEKSLKLHQIQAQPSYRSLALGISVDIWHSSTCSTCQAV